MIFISCQESIVVQNVFFCHYMWNISHIIQAKRQLDQDDNHVLFDNNSLFKIYKDCQILKVMIEQYIKNQLDCSKENGMNQKLTIEIR